MGDGNDSQDRRQEQNLNNKRKSPNHDWLKGENHDLSRGQEAETQKA